MNLLRTLLRVERCCMTPWCAPKSTWGSREKKGPQEVRKCWNHCPSTIFLACPGHMPCESVLPVQGPKKPKISKIGFCFGTPQVRQSRQNLPQVKKPKRVSGGVSEGSRPTTPKRVKNECPVLTLRVKNHLFVTPETHFWLSLGGPPGPAETPLETLPETPFSLFGPGLVLTPLPDRRDPKFWSRETPISPTPEKGISCITRPIFALVAGQLGAGRSKILLESGSEAHACAGPHCEAPGRSSGAGHEQHPKPENQDSQNLLAVRPNGITPKRARG